MTNSNIKIFTGQSTKYLTQKIVDCYGIPLGKSFLDIGTENCIDPHEYDFDANQHDDHCWVGGTRLHEFQKSPESRSSSSPFACASISLSLNSVANAK